MRCSEERQITEDETYSFISVMLSTNGLLIFSNGTKQYAITLKLFPGKKFILETELYK